MLSGFGIFCLGTFTGIVLAGIFSQPDSINIIIKKREDDK